LLNRIPGNRRSDDWKHAVAQFARRRKRHDESTDNDARSTEIKFSPGNEVGADHRGLATTDTDIR
jgi:hypothetical protein